MAKSFYSAQEAAERLGKTEDELKDLVRDGTIREFRDAGSVNYRVDDIEKAASTLGLADSGAGLSSSGGLGDSGASDLLSNSGSASGEILLEPADDSGIELSPSSSDILSLEDVDTDSSDDTSAGTKPGARKEDTAVASVGISVFDDEDLDEHVDPLAQTAISDVGGLGMEGSGSGSGILDLAKSEPDDTSLGAELLDEIYTGDDDASADTTSEDTRAGLDDISSDDSGTVDEEFHADMDEGVATSAGVAVVRQVVEYPPDAVSTALTAGLFVAVIVMWFAGLAGAAMVRGVVPGLLEVVSDNLAIFAGGSMGVTIMAAGVTFFMAKRSG